MSIEALYSKTSPLGFLLDDDEARQLVYNGLEDWAADNDDSPDDTMFHAVHTSCALTPKKKLLAQMKSPCERADPSILLQK